MAIGKRSEISEDTIHLGGTVSCGRIYLEDLEFDMSNGQHIKVSKTFKPDIMEDLIARHKGRYHLLGLFCRPGMRLLDFPCGSGYAAKLLKDQGIIYEGRDMDNPTLEYARRLYGGPMAEFKFGVLEEPDLGKGKYDLIGCLEGIEHIGEEFQESLVFDFYNALKKNGVLVISSPENSTGISGPSEDNKWHKWELNKEDFLSLLSVFGKENVELITLREVLHTGTMSTCFYAVCYKR